VGHGQRTRYSACAANRPVLCPGPAAAATGSLPAGKRPHPVTVAVLLAAWLAVAWSAWRVWRQFERVEVFGHSMVPALQPGDHVLVRKNASVRRGDIVAACDPRVPARSVLKRVAGVSDEGVFLLGDNAEHSTDSRQWGPVPMTSVQGRAMYRYAPPARAGRLPKYVSDGGQMVETEFTEEMAAAGRPVSVWANGPGDTYGVHTHSYGKILCCLEGSITFHTDKGDVALEAGDRMVLPPGTPHSATVGTKGTRCAEAHILSS
jgi:nickel-type superoxide dismutase maturation protease